MTDYEKRFVISLVLFFLMPPVWLIYKIYRLCSRLRVRFFKRKCKDDDDKLTKYWIE